MEKLMGVVICGGKSSRMGTDKGLLPLDGKPWAIHNAEKLTALGLHAVLSVNEMQVGAYSRYFPADRLIIDQPIAAGPLRGIVSVHHQFPANDLLVLACDIINMNGPTLETLVNLYRDSTGSDYYAYHNGKLWEPLCAIYTGKALSALSPACSNSLQDILHAGRTVKIQVGDSTCFVNNNRRLES